MSRQVEATKRGGAKRAWGSIGRGVGWGVVVVVIGVMLASIAGKFHAKVPPDERSSAAAGREPVGARADGSVGWEIVEVRRITQPRYETAVGTIKPVHETVIAAKLLARVVQVELKAGQGVTAGEVLVRLDDADLQTRVKQAEAAVSAAAARKQQTAADFARAKNLINSNAISQAEYDQAESATKGAQSEFDRATQAVREANVVLGYATIVSPLTGIVVEKKIDVGDTVTPGQPLLTVYDPTRMQMVASVRESLAQRLVVGESVPARIDSLGYECNAVVSEIVPESEGASRSFSVKVTGPCPEGVLSGMFGRLLVPLQDEEILVIPHRAVRQVGQLWLVDVMMDGSIQRRAVQVGRTLGGDIEVLSGLRLAERVIVDRGSMSKGE